MKDAMLLDPLFEFLGPVWAAVRRPVLDWHASYSMIACWLPALPLAHPSLALSRLSRSGR